jgi:lysophospholipase L1-like esterase
MAAIGDSITRAFDVCCFYGERPEHSWTTGDDASDVIGSHYERILAGNPAIEGFAYNDAETGANMADAPAQASVSVSRGVEYVTILMGANDLCTDSPSTMTRPDEFRAQFGEAMAILAEGLPDAHIFVSSIPDIYQLWFVLHDDPEAQLVWLLAQICQSMLDPFNTERQRQKVVRREFAFNRILKDVCGRYPNCRFAATYSFKFAKSQVSTLDFFHPNLDGQAALADVTWAASWWPGLDR